jgi:plastocyanin
MDTVTWIFNGQEPHTVSFLDHFSLPFNPLDPRIGALQQEVGPSYFDNFTATAVSSGLRSARALNYTLTFNSTGSFPYLCAIHPSMYATLRVRDWNQTLSKDADDVFSQGNDELEADSTYALGDFVKQAKLLDQVSYTEDPDGYRTWKVWDGIYAQPSQSSESNATGAGSGVGPISAYDFYPGNGVFNISAGDRIQFINRDEGIHTLALQTNSTFIPFAGNNYILSYIPDSQLNLNYNGGFQDYGVLVPFDPEHNNHTITFKNEGKFYVFCTLHSGLGMHALINVLPENEEEGNQTTSSTGVQQTQSSTGTIASSTGFNQGHLSSTGGNFGGTGGHFNAAATAAHLHPAIILLTSLLAVAALM